MLNFKTANHRFSLSFSRYWHVAFAPGWFGDGDLYFAGFLRIEVYNKVQVQPSQIICD